MGQITKPCGCIVEQKTLTNNVANSSVSAIGEIMISECSTCEQARLQEAENLKQQRIKELKNAIVALETEKDKATALGYTDIVSDKQTEITTLQIELDSLTQ